MRSTRATVALLLCFGLLCAVSALSFVAAQAPLNILDFGAVAGDTSSEAAVTNSNALIAAFTAASSSAARRAEAKVAPAQARKERWDAVLDYSRASYSDEGLASVGPTTMSRLFFTDATSSSVEAGSSTVLVPAGLEFTIGWTVLTGFSNVLFQIQGTLVVSQNESLWDLASDGDFGVLHFVGCSGVTVQGKTQSYNGSDPVPTSAIDVVGAGYSWWANVIAGKWDHRPHLFYLDQCVSMVLLSLYVTDSPQYHFLSNDGAEHFFKNIVVKVDVVAQSKLLEAGGYASLMSLVEDPVGLVQSGLPLFPLNTDGIDPSANPVLIEDFYIENFDDAIAVKPCQETGPNSKFCQCAGDILARNGAVKFSVGLTIGSVPPHADTNCVRNVTFDNISMDLPFKMVYIKSNPGVVGRGVIDQITYSNIQAHSPLWYPIWIGPQQQKQPGNGSDTGCSFLYPIVSNNTCATQPLVTMSNIALYNVTASGGITLPGVFLCDPTNPCTGVVMDSVSNEGTWFVSPNYVCHNVQGSQVNNNPPLNCLTSSLPTLQEETNDATAAN